MRLQRVFLAFCAAFALAVVLIANIETADNLPRQRDPRRGERVSERPHAKIEEDRTHLRDAARILIIGTTVDAYLHPVARALHQLAVTNELQIPKLDSRFQHVSWLITPWETIKQRAAEANAVLITGEVIGSLCALDGDSGFLPSALTPWANVDDVIMPTLDRVRRVRLFNALLTSMPADVLKASFVYDAHAYGFGNRGYAHIARCFARLNLSVLLSISAFGPDMMAIASALDAMRKPMEIVAFPNSYFDLAAVLPLDAQRVRHRDIDVLLCGSHWAGPYPFRNRVFFLMRAQVNLSVVSCMFGETRVHERGRRNGLDYRMEANRGTFQGYFDLIRRSKLVVTTAAGRAFHWVYKYNEIAMHGSVVLGNLPYDATSFFTPDDMVLIQEHQTDAEIVGAVERALADAPALEAKARRVQRKMMQHFDVKLLPGHVLDVMYPRSYAPFPPFRNKSFVPHNLVDMLLYNTWDRQEAFYKTLARSCFVLSSATD